MAELKEQPTSAPTRKVRAATIGSVGGGLGLGVPIATITAYYAGVMDPNMPEAVQVAISGVVSSIITTISGLIVAWLTKELSED